MIKINNLLFSLLLLSLLLTSISMIQGCATVDAARMPIMVQPYYNSDPLTINVGEMSEKLMSNKASDILELANSIVPNDASIPTEALYVMAIRLFDLNEKKPAAYWFYNAQFRTKVLNALLTQNPDYANNEIGNESFEKLSAYNAFTELAGPYINQELSQKPNEWVEIIDMVQKDMTNLDIRGFVNDFPKIADKIVNDHPEVLEKVNEGLSILKNILQENLEEMVQETKNKNQ